MKSRLLCAVLSLLLLLAVSGCTANSVSALEDGTLPLEEFQSEDGVFEYEKLPIGLSKGEAVQRLGLEMEDLGNPMKLDSYETYTLPEEKWVSYGDWEAVPMLEFNSGEIEMVHFRFTQYHGKSDGVAAVDELAEKLTQDLEARYGTCTVIENELEGATSTVYNWESDAEGQHTILRFSQVYSENTNYVLNLAMGLFEIPETAQE